MKLICLHQAGAARSTFRSWQDRAPHPLDVVPVGLPTVGAGTQRRRRYSSTETLIPALAAGFERGLDDRRYLLFGHSMGALLAYLLARWFCERGGPRPHTLIVACCVAPHWAERPEGPKDPGVAALVRWLSSIGGLPDWLAGHEELLTPYVGLIRDDLQLCFGYRHVPQLAPLDVPVRVFGATDDALVKRHELVAWRSIARDVRVDLLPGDHFLVTASGELLRQCVFDVATAAMAQPSAEPAPRARGHTGNGRGEEVYAHHSE